MKIKLTCLIALLTLWLSPLFGVEYYMLSDVGTSARSIALGNIEGLGESGNSIFENPAAMYQIKNYSFSVFKTTFFNELEYLNVNAAASLGNFSFGVGYMTMFVDGLISTEVDMTDSDLPFIEEGTFSYKKSIIKLSSEYSFTDKMHVGVGYSLYTDDVDTITAEGGDIDAGFFFDNQTEKLSLSVKNIMGSTVDFSTGGQETLPRQVVAAAMKEFKLIKVYGQLKVNGSDGLSKSAGIGYKPNNWEFLELNLGYKEYFALGEHSNSTSAGLSLYLGDVSFHYALEKSDYVLTDNNSYFSLNLNF